MSMRGSSVIDTLAARAQKLGLFASIVDEDAAHAGLIADALRVGAERHVPAHSSFDVFPETDDWLLALASGPNGTRLVLGCPKTASAASAHGLSALPQGMEPAAILGVLGDMHSDLLGQKQSSEDMELFTSQLDDSFEAITLLYRLGEQMQQFLEPEAFLRKAMQGLCDLLSLSWSAVTFIEDPAALGPLSGRLLAVTEDRTGSRILGENFARRLDSLIATEHSGIAQTDDPMLGPEVVLRPIQTPGTTAGWIALGGKRGRGVPGDDRASSFDTQTTEAVATFIGSVLESRRLYHEQQATFMGTLRALSSTLDAKDPYTRGHSERVALLARQLAEAIGLDKAECDRIHLAGTLHDIGKIGVPDRVLRKPGKLTDEEFEMIKLHPTIGHNILEPIPVIKDLLPAVLHHHERWDGRGYPDRLEGENIPLQARILALADTFDAMSSNRAYRSSRSREEVLTEFARVKGVQFDPELVEPFVNLDFSLFDAMKLEHEATEAGNQASDMPIDDAA